MYSLYLPATIAFSKYSTADRVSLGVPSPAMYMVPVTVGWIINSQDVEHLDDHCYLLHIVN